MTKSNIAIDAKNVTKIFGGENDRVIALDNVSIEIEENEFFTLLGPSGCGKTTLLRLIAGFEHATEGQILLHGDEISQLPPYQRPVNTVFQNYALFPHMSVAENISFGLEMQNKPTEETNETVSRMLQLVQMEALRDRRTDQISGGQQQRVALARALAPQPRVLLLDEPLSALDYKLRKEMQIELKRLQHETGITFIFVTHDQEEALTMSDRVAVMNAGKVLQVGAPHEIYDHPSERFVADFIGDTNFVSANIESVENGRANVVLPGGSSVIVETDLQFSDQAIVTLAIRPEQIELSGGDDAVLHGELENIVYIGTDTNYHLRMDSGESLVCRVQNTRGRESLFESGNKIGVKFDAESLQILKD